MSKEYVGDSATLSYLQIIRKDVESIAGPSPFTADPHQHQIVESTACLPQNIRNAHLLPERKTAVILVDSFFINVSELRSLLAERELLTTNRHVDFSKSSITERS